MKDPRTDRNFIPKLYPSCDGQPFDLVFRTDRLRAIKARFLAAYYQINVEYARLKSWRRAKGRRARPDEERTIQQALEKAILAREKLEDRHASRGIVASPLYQGGFAINVQFQCPGSPAAPPLRVASSSCCSIQFFPPGGGRRSKK